MIHKSRSYQEKLESTSTLHDLPDEDDGELPF
jgi:hypothetical protein